MRKRLLRRPEILTHLGAGLFYKVPHLGAQNFPLMAHHTAALKVWKTLKMHKFLFF